MITCMSSNNAVILLKAQTYGEIKKGETLDFVKRPYEFDKLEDGDIVVQSMYLSVDPYMVSSSFVDTDLKRGKIRDPSIKSYTPVYPILTQLIQAFEVGKPLYGLGVGEFTNRKIPSSRKVKLWQVHWTGRSIRV